MNVDPLDDITWKQVRLRLEKNRKDDADIVKKLIIQDKLDEAIKYIDNSIRISSVNRMNFRGVVSTTKSFPVKDAGDKS